MARGTNLKTRKGRKIKRKYKIRNENEVLSAKEKIKQTIQLKAQRIRRYEKRSGFYRLNKIFQSDAKKFYREIRKRWACPKEHNKSSRLDYTRGRTDEK